MKISTRGRYALRVMIDLAEHNSGDYIPLTDIAGRQEISEKYLESIVSMLSKSGFLMYLRGKGGGYRLTRLPEEYSVREILEVTEGSLAPIACLEQPTNTCPRASVCKSLDMWQGLYDVMRDYLSGISIADLAADTMEPGNFII
ncbi:MAG: Rrf2 family transcriptional regulator [Lachnospiraceae bacterium]|nr:Rrf2 family transcriptional regulator [Lachnospiraceae bacterium]